MYQIQLPSLTRFTSIIVSTLTRLKFSAFLLFLLITIWCLPAKAATKITPQLEQQVLEIIRNHPEVVIESVQGFQQQQQQQLQSRQQAFVEGLKTNSQNIIDNSPLTGNADAKVVLVEFSDFQCPYCAQAHKTLKEFMAKHQNEVKLVYKHLPLVAAHPEAMNAAKASWAANQQGKFWEYQDVLFSQQDDLGEDFYVETAKKLNLDLEKFNSDRNSNNATIAIQQDVQLGQEIGITGTPFFVMNDQAISGAVPLADLENVLAQVKNS